MKKLFTLVLAAASLGAAAQKPAVDFSPYGRGVYHSPSGDSMQYRVLYPENYTGDKKYPLFIFLHGAGKLGTDNASQLDLGGELFLRPENRAAYPCIVLYPQSRRDNPFIDLNLVPASKRAGAEDARNFVAGPAVDLRTQAFYTLFELIDKVVTENRVDAKRIYVSGISLGGFTIYEMLRSRPGFFAACGPLCGMTFLGNVDTWAGRTPVRIFHGAKDNAVSVECSRMVVGRLKELGVVDYLYNEYPTWGHPILGAATAEPDYLGWLFSRERK